MGFKNQHSHHCGAPSCTPSPSSGTNASLFAPPMDQQSIFISLPLLAQRMNVTATKKNKANVTTILLRTSTFLIFSRLACFKHWKLTQFSHLKNTFFEKNTFFKTLLHHPKQTVTPPSEKVMARKRRLRRGRRHTYHTIRPQRGRFPSRCDEKFGNQPLVGG